MSNLHVSERAAKYRYTIQELLDLASTAYIPFNLAKFSYDAARAGVVPSLGDCAMSSRQSSASYIRSKLSDLNSSSDCIVFNGTHVALPDRQPEEPPVAYDQQKAEGFARFLKQHSSPTHNRVTAGGRIVPMEPRSPPPFTLPTNPSSKIPNVAREGQQDGQIFSTSPWGEDTTRSKGFQEHREYQPTFLKNAIPPHIEAQQLDRAQALAGPAPDGASQGIWPHTGYGEYQNQSMTNIRPSYELPGPIPYTAEATMPYSTYAGHDSYYAPPAQLGMGVSLCENFVRSAGSWPSPNAEYPHRTPLSAHPTPQQMLAAWEQHYRDLDTQLNNIDRHRAMTSLDQNLAQQRRVIVQQRSDAKDTIREYQALLGQRRMPDSSTDSWVTSFNVEAPPYIPPAGNFGSYEFPKIEHTPNPVPFEKPRGSGQRRAIPIVRPPSADSYNSPSKKAVEAGTIALQMVQHMREQLSAQNSHEDMKTHTPRQDSVDSWSDGRTDHPVAVQHQHVNTSNMTFVVPPNKNPPNTVEEQSNDIVAALERPAGTLSRVRLMDNNVVEISGTGKQFSQTTSPVDDPWSSVESKQHVPPAPKFDFGPFKIDNRSSQSSFEDVSGKENLMVDRRNHTKAATDVFVDHYEVVAGKLASLTMQDTHSLRALSTHSGSAAINQPRETFQNQSYGIPASRQSSHFSQYIADDAMHNKGYSSVGVQNVHAIGLPNTFDGAKEARQSVQAHVGKSKSPKSPRLLRRSGASGPWYGPHCRNILERATNKSSESRSARSFHQ